MTRNVRVLARADDVRVSQGVVTGTGPSHALDTSAGIRAQVFRCPHPGYQAQTSQQAYTHTIRPLAIQIQMELNQR